MPQVDSFESTSWQFARKIECEQNVRCLAAVASPQGNAFGVVQEMELSMYSKQRCANVALVLTAVFIFDQTGELLRRVVGPMLARSSIASRLDVTAFEQVHDRVWCGCSDAVIRVFQITVCKFLPAALIESSKCS